MTDFPYENYAHFHPDTTDLQNFGGPAAGDIMGALMAERAEDGSQWHLSDHQGQWVVIETGCLTCPMYNAEIERMNALAQDYPDICFIMLYVREAHPGQNLPGLCSLDDKRARGKQVAAHKLENRTVLVDDLAGTMHQRLGAMPNSIHLIRPDGVVAWRTDWSNYDLLKKLLAERRDDLVNILEHHEKTDLMMKPSVARQIVFPTLKRAGKGALWDIIKSLPYMIRDHARAMKAFPAERRFSKKKAGL